MEKWFVEVDSLLGTIKIKADNAAHTPVAMVATPVDNDWLNNSRWRKAAYDKAHLIASAPELLSFAEKIAKVGEGNAPSIGFMTELVQEAKFIVNKSKGGQ